MIKRKQSHLTIAASLSDPRVRRGYLDGKTYYAITDVVRILAETDYPDEYWAELKKREPVLSGSEIRVEIEQTGGPELVEATDQAGVLRIIQSIASPRAERLKKWLIESGVQRLEEQDNPELAVLRLRRVYEDKGYSPRWIDKRLRGVSTRHELTSEWARRGATQGDQYRALTNALMENAFGMDVEHMRRYKQLQGTGQNLRDHMSDVELVLVALGETAAVTLGRNRGSQGIEQLLADAQDAGRIAGLARQQIEQGSAKRPVADKADVERLTAPRVADRGGDRSESVESSAHRTEPASAG
jgi:DNA-damage-inducible protein D